MESQAKPLNLKVGPVVLSQRHALQAGIFVAAFATAACLAVVFRPGSGERPLLAIQAASPAVTALQTITARKTSSDPALRPALADASAGAARLPEVPAAIKSDEDADAIRATRLALADALRSSPLQPQGGLVAARPISGDVFSGPQKSEPLPSAPVNVARQASAIPANVSSFANPDTAGAVTANPALASIQAAAPVASRQPLPQADLQRMASHAARSIRSGDIAGARLILERAAEAGDATALYALAQTYDPDVLTKMRVRGLEGDRARAQTLYKQAADAGVPAAKERVAGAN
jgi:TPR repeat protein